MKTQATAYISQNKNRLRIYKTGVSISETQHEESGNLYLNNGDNFEIELFNGYSTEVLAKIWINDEIISQGGLIIKPGQRYFLERFLETNNKFKFNTYEVEGTQEVIQAIKNNGKIKVQFYKKNYYPSQYGWSYSYSNNHIIYDNYINYSGTSFNLDVQGTNNPISYSSCTSDLQSLNVGTQSVNLKSAVKSSMETGRIEKGEASNQNFDYTQMEFSPFVCDSFEWHILPISQQPFDITTIKNYCSRCGTRIRKQSWKFCPTCGILLD